MSEISLYTYFRSSCAYRVRIGLNLKKISYKMIPIHLLRAGGEQNGNTFRKINAMAQVPTLQIDSFTLSQSLAILEYIEEKYPQPALLPQNREERALIRQMNEVINSGLQPLQGLAVTQFLERELKVTTEQKQQWLNHWIGKGLAAYEDLLKKYAGTYSFGDSITMADCCLVPQIFSAERFKVDLTPYPLSRKIYDRCLSQEAFLLASPAKQPDFEP